MKADENAYSKYSAEVHLMISSYAQEMEEKYGFYFEGSGGRMHEKIEEFNVSLMANHRISIEEAREIMVNAVSRLLELINTNEKIKPYLETYPFDESRVFISIAFQRNEVCYYQDGSVVVASLIKNKILYSESNFFTGKLQILLKEPYEEAARIVKEHPLQRDLRCHKQQGFEEEIDSLQESFVMQIRKEYGLKWQSFGGKMTNGIEQVGFCFIGYKKKAPLERARKIEIEITEKLLKLINSNSKLRPYLKHFPFEAKDVIIKIDFMRDKYDYYMDRSIAQTYLKEGRLYYLHQPPDEPQKDYIKRYELVPLHEESYEEAKKLLGTRL